MDLVEAMGVVAKGIEVLGVAALVAGLVVAVVLATLALSRGEGGDVAFRILRTVFGRSVLLGLEFLVAADIIRTVGIEPSLENVAVLGLIVLIRTFLSLSIGVEIEGTWPWRRAAASAPGEPRPSR